MHDPYLVWIIILQFSLPSLGDYPPAYTVTAHWIQSYLPNIRGVYCKTEHVTQDGGIPIYRHQSGSFELEMVAGDWVISENKKPIVTQKSSYKKPDTAGLPWWKTTSKNNLLILRFSANLRPG